MKKITLTLLACCVAFVLNAAEGEWTTDLPKALQKAKAENKLVFLDFTGSDWCPPCKALHKNILTSKEFVSYAKTNLVLVEVDFPRSKPQTKELKAANAALSKRFNIQGYPTVIVLDAQGKELKREIGFSGGDPKSYIASLEKLKK
jgi:Thiol:disulfide interchange protein